LTFDTAQPMTEDARQNEEAEARRSWFDTLTTNGLS
jgi:hypothetical protein